MTMPWQNHGNDDGICICGALADGAGIASDIRKTLA